MRFIAHACVAAFALSVAFAHAAGPTGYLNDTGQTTCYKADTTAGDCAVDATDNGALPRQDARFGRDAKTGLAKTGAGAAGFDFSCVLWDGTVDNSANCATTLTANLTTTASGTPATDWACTKDNHTNLIWSLESGQGVWVYATSTYPAATNTAGRCGFTTGWRVPTRRELLSIVYNDASNPAIDTTYFPNTASSYYWSSDPYVLDTASAAWDVNFNDGRPIPSDKANTDYVRLVRSGQ